MNQDQSSPQQSLHMDGKAKERLQSESIGEKIGEITASLPPGDVTLAEIMDAVGQDGLLILTAFLTLVFLVPVSIPGVSTVFGAAILLIGLSRLFGRNLWLPERIARRALPSDKLRAALDRGRTWLHRLEKVSRPHRMNALATGAMADTLNNCGLVLGAVLLMAPFGLIPFSNTFPAVAVLLLSIGLMQRDGLCILLGHLANVATMIYFAILIGGGGAAVVAAFRHFFGNP